MTEAEVLDIIAPLAERMDKLIVAVEKLVAVLRPSDLAQYHASAPRMASDGPPDPEPPRPVSADFRESRDLPPAPFLPNWACPKHGQVKTVPAGISKAGKPYTAFLACPVAYCDEKPPRAPR